MGKEHRWPLEAQQLGNESLEPACSLTNTSILAHRILFSILSYTILR